MGKRRNNKKKTVQKLELPNPKHSPGNKPTEDWRNSGKKAGIVNAGYHEKTFSNTTLEGTMQCSSRLTATTTKARPAKGARRFDQKSDALLISRERETLFLLGFSDSEISSFSQEEKQTTGIQASKNEASSLEMEQLMTRLLKCENSLDEPQVIGFSDHLVQTVEPFCYGKSPDNDIRNNFCSETRGKKPHTSIRSWTDDDQNFGARPDACDQNHAGSSNFTRSGNSRDSSGPVKSRAFAKQNSSEPEATNADRSGASITYSHSKTLAPYDFLNHGTSLAGDIEKENSAKSFGTNQNKTNSDNTNVTGGRKMSEDKLLSSGSIAKVKPLDRSHERLDKPQISPKYGNKISCSPNYMHASYSASNAKVCFQSALNKWLLVRNQSIEKLRSLLLRASNNEEMSNNIQLNCKYGSAACKQEKLMAPTWTWELATSFGSMLCDLAGGVSSVVQMVNTDIIQSEFQQIMDEDEVATKKMYEVRSKYVSEYRYTDEIIRKFGGTTLGDTLYKISESVGITEFFRQMKKANDNREDTVVAAVRAIDSIFNRNCSREVGREVVDAVQDLVDCNPACVGTVAGIGKSLYEVADMRMLPVKRSGDFGTLVKIGTNAVDRALLAQEQRDIADLERKMRCGTKSKIQKDIQEALDMLEKEKDEMLELLKKL